jgi:ABC-type lipoprotein export system ATPase subunit
MNAILPVAVQDVVRVYDDGGERVRALDGVSFEARAGELIALVGPSGCGKSTLLNLIGCIDLPTSGQVLIDGRSTHQLGDDALTLLRRLRVGTVFQFFNLLPALTVAENVALPLVLAKTPEPALRERVREALERVGLGERGRSYPAQLSAGQMQRAALARAVVNHPAVLLADEPTGNLDSRNGASVLDLLRGLAADGQTIVMATHSAEAAAVAHRVIRLSDGKIVSHE